MAALQKEISDLLRRDTNGQSALVEVDLKDPALVKLPKVFTTIVVKRKATGIFKARLVLRGDMAPTATQQFMSAPTAARSMVRIVLSLASNLRLTLGTVDASQAFLQSDVVHPSERMVAISPRWIPLPWNGELLGPLEENSAPPVTKGLLTIRPLYGG